MTRRRDGKSVINDAMMMAVGLCTVHGSLLRQVDVQRDVLP